MTTKQVADLLKFARERIAFHLRRCQILGGNGVNIIGGNQQVVFLDPSRATRADREQEQWGVAISGYTVSVSQGDVTYPPPTPPLIYTNEVTSDESVLLTANARGIMTNLLTDRVAFYEVQQPPASGFILFRQSITMRVVSYSFPVRVVFQVTERPAGGAEIVTEQNLDFTSGDEETLVIEQTTDGQRIVTAVAVIRL